MEAANRAQTAGEFHFSSEGPRLGKRKPWYPSVVPILPGSDHAEMSYE